MGERRFIDDILLIPLVGLNEIKMASKLHMYLDSCKGASLHIDMARSYQTNKVRHGAKHSPPGRQGEGVM